jgi:hypothetical protein
VQETAGPWVARAVAAAAGGNSTLAEEVRDRIQRFERRVSNLLEVAPPGARPALLRLQAYLAEQDRLLAAVLEARRDAPRSEPPRPASPGQTPPVNRDSATAAGPGPVAPVRPASTDMTPARVQPTATATGVPVRGEPTSVAATPVRAAPTATATVPVKPTPTPIDTPLARPRRGS